MGAERKPEDLSLLKAERRASNIGEIGEQLKAPEQLKLVTLRLHRTELLQTGLVYVLEIADRRRGESELTRAGGGQPQRR